MELSLPATRSTQLSLILAASCLICFSSSPFSIYSPLGFLKYSTFIPRDFASELQLGLLSLPLTYITLASLCWLSKAAEYHPKCNPAQYYQLPSKTRAHPKLKSPHSDLPSPKNPSHPYWTLSYISLSVDEPETISYAHTVPMHKSKHYPCPLQ